MIKLPQIEPDIAIRVPLPHANITQADLNKTRAEFSADGARVSLRAEEVYPISASWAEIAILTLTGAAAKHYAGKCFDALDRFLKKEIDQINLGGSMWDRIVYRDVPRRDRDQVIAKIREAIDELEAIDREDATA